MEEEKRLPKNIRQMAEKEERVRVYLEDYAYTFIHKLNCASRVRTGVLLGSRMVTENKRCWFVKGAVEFEEKLEEQNKEADSDETKKEGITQQIWDNTQSVIQQYFPGCSVCGWFICGSEENFPDGEQLKKTHRQIFSGENCLMYWKQGDEDSFWIEDEDAILHLKGYFVYYEKNPEMQNYMLSRQEEKSEAVSDQAALNFRKIMKEKQDTKHVPKRKPAKQTRQFALENGFLIKAGVAVLFILLVGGGVLASRGMKRPEDSVQALAVGASVERQSGEIEKDSFAEESANSMAVEGSVIEEQESVETSAFSGLESEKADATDQKVQTQTTDADQKAQTQTTGIDQKAQDEADKKDVASMQNNGIFSGDMMFYKDGLGASVYRITDKNNSAGTSSSSIDIPPKENEADEQNTENSSVAESTQEILTVEIPTVAAGGGEAANAEQSAQDSAAEVAINRPASYTVQPGDTLLAISKKFYGSSQMVMQIKEANGLDDVNKIYIGQELTLP